MGLLQKWRGGRPVLGLVLLLLFPPAPACAEDFSSRSWTTDHGLPQNCVQALCPGRDGFLWVGTRYGLARFDGLEFRTFATGNEPELAEASVTALGEDGRGGLWIGTPGGLLHWSGGRFTREPLLSGRRIWAILPGPGDEVWLGITGSVARLQSGHLDLIPIPDSAHAGVRSLEWLEDGRMVVTSLAGWLTLDLPTRRFTPWFPAVPTGPATAEPAAAGRATWRRIPIAAHSPESITREFFTPGERTVSDHTWGPRLTPDGRGGWWVVTLRRQLVHMGPEGVARIEPPQADVFHEVLCTARDAEGGLWIGTPVAGLIRLHPRPFEHHLVGEGEQAPCFSVAASSDGSIWAASKERLLRWREGRSELFPIALPNPNRQILSLLPDSSEAVWLSRDRTGLFRWTPRTLEDLSPALGLDGDRIRALARTRDGALWVGSQTGLTRWDGTAVQRFGAPDGLPHADVRAIHEDRTGRLWVATHGGGAAWRDGDRFRRFSVEEGLNDPYVWGFLEDRTGALWIYGRRGLTRVLGNRATVVTRAHGLLEDLTNQMFEDAAGDFWLGCNRGLYRVRGEDLHAVAEGRQSTLECAVFGSEDGLPVAETNGESQPAGARAPDGSLWFPTPVGAVRVQPARVPRHETPPPVLMEWAGTESLPLLEDGRENPQLRRTPDGTLLLPPGSARVLTLRFVAPSFAAPERTRHRHRLVGYESDWIEGRSREALYINLRPGRYRFEVTACNDHGVWNPVPAAFSFELAPQWWETPAFPPVAIGTAVLLGWGIHWGRLRFVRRRLALEGELRLARERERIARDMHDDVGAGLTQIGFLTERASRTGGEPVAPLMGRIAEATRQTAQAMDEIVWAVNPRNDRLEPLANYVCQYAREFLSTPDIRCRLQVPALLPDVPVPSTVRHHLLMMLKECLSNVARHSGATEVTVELDWNRGTLRLAVSDNGRGFEGADAPRPRPGGGSGLANLRRRAEALGGRCSIESRPGSGTRIEVTLALEDSPAGGL
ncbi:MAG: hypothetical protein JNL10_10370 [Verrucomicrobiales bacterium]|nr:hypothetical protein [Verrucomicrobiales bacterium]